MREPWMILLAWAIGQYLCITFASSQLPCPRLHIPFNNKWRKHCFSFLIIDGATLLYHRMDILMLEWLSTASELGNYAAAFKFLDLVILLAAPIGIVFFRFFSEKYLAKQKLITVIIVFCIILELLAICVVCLWYLTAQHIIDISFGNTYSQTIIISQILMLSLLLIFPNLILSQANIVIGNETRYSKFSIATFLVNFALNIVLIPYYGAFGAAISTIVTEIILFVFLFFLLFVFFKKQNNNNYCV